MKFKIFSILFLLIFSTSQGFAWGKIGHRVVGEVASFYLSKRASKKIHKILGGHSMAQVSNWMDNIKSNDAYDYTTPLHWVSIPKGMTYEETEKNKDGDLIQTINRLVDELKKGNLTNEEEAKNLKMLIHLIGDIHQPLHVGTGTDRGGNEVYVKWFGQNSNLHRVWDSQIIDGKQYSYTELADVVNFIEKDELKSFQEDTITEWYTEAMNLRPQLYDLPEDSKLGYEYSYENWSTVKKQLLKGGVRLAAVLNDIYG